MERWRFYASNKVTQKVKGISGRGMPLDKEYSVRFWDSFQDLFFPTFPALTDRAF